MTRKEHFTLRLPADTIRRLVKLAERQGRTKTALAERYLEEGLRMAEHPGIVFRDGPAGRRAGLSGCGLDVWEVIETFLGEGNDAKATAEYFNLSLSVITTVVNYYADYKDEVDRWIQSNADFAEEAEATWRRRQDLLTV